MVKGKTTRDSIVERAIAGASLRGLNALTIGTLAAELHMSKSGVFAHFGSKEILQRDVVNETFRLFAKEVIDQALKVDPGLQQIKAFFDHWIDWSLDERRPGGCPIVGAAFDLDGQPGDVRDLVAEGFRQWTAVLKNAVEKAKRRDLKADTDADLFVFQIIGLYLAHQLNRWLLDDVDASRRAKAAFDILLSGSREETPT